MCVCVPVHEHCRQQDPDGFMIRCISPHKSQAKPTSKATAPTIPQGQKTHTKETNMQLIHTLRIAAMILPLFAPTAAYQLTRADATKYTEAKSNPSMTVFAFRLFGLLFTNCNAFAARFGAVALADGKTVNEYKSDIRSRCNSVPHSPVFAAVLSYRARHSLKMMSSNAKPHQRSS